MNTTPPRLLPILSSAPISHLIKNDPSKIIYIYI